MFTFLDVNIFGENKQFATKVYRKKTFSGVYNSFKSFTPERYKIGLIKSLLFWCFSLCSDFIIFHRETDKLKNNLYKSNQPIDLVYKCIKEFLDRNNDTRACSKLSRQICTRINCIIKNKPPYCNIRFVFQTKCKISNFFTFKNTIPSFLRFGIVYKFQCGVCNAILYGKNFILRSECVNTWEFLHSLRQALKVTIILRLKKIFYSAITHRI